MGHMICMHHTTAAGTHSLCPHRSSLYMSYTASVACRLFAASILRSSCTNGTIVSEQTAVLPSHAAFHRRQEHRIRMAG